MKTNLSLLTITGLLLAASHMPAQSTGTSHPETLDDSITVAKPQPMLVKPSPAVPVATPAPALRERTATVAVAPEAVEPAPAATPSPSAVIADDDNSGVVIDVPSPANELPEGTLIRVKLGEEISTRDTEPDVQFNALLSAPVMHDGRVIMPAGAVLTGRITELNSGHHIGRAAAIHLQPELVTLPNGMHYKITGQVIDLSSDHYTRVNSEGTIISNDPTPGTASAVGVSTGTGAIAGAVLGGGVGAVVGAGIGAGISGGVWANQRTSATLRKGTDIVFSLNEPMLLKSGDIAD